MVFFADCTVLTIEQIDKDVEKAYRAKLHREYQQQKLQEKMEGLEIQENGEEEDSTDEIQLDPCWLFDILTDDILLLIIKKLVAHDPFAFTSFASCCSKLNKLCFSSEIYRKICELVYPFQVYNTQSIELNNISMDQSKMVQFWDFNWKSMLNDRPFIKYHGCYISKISYISEGSNESSFYNPTKIVTYFRFMRFYPSGKVLKLTTTDEPQVVIPQFKKENVNSIKNAKLADFTITIDGAVLISSVTESYKFSEEFKIVDLGYRKFHRLNWVTSSFVNSDGEIGEFNLQKERPFNFSNVKSYIVEMPNLLK